MITFCIIGMVVCMILLILNEYFHGYRNNKVCELRNHILWKYDMQVYVSLPSYNRMMYSFKPLKEEYWIKKEYFK